MILPCAKKSLTGMSMRLPTWCTSRVPGWGARGYTRASMSSQLVSPTGINTKQVSRPIGARSASSVHEHFFDRDAKVIALQTALDDRDPFYSGMCALPDYQRALYYNHGDLTRRIDFSSARTDDLGALYRACKPAEFGRNGENVYDESYRKAGKMDLTSFATQFDPRSTGIHEQVSKALLTQNFAAMDMELYKLNVYGKGDFFRSHKDTPRSQDMIGSLVVVLPTAHEGGQLVLRHGEKEWTVDFTEKIAAAAEPSVCFVAFFGDIEHEVLPVTSGYRVTLTYNLYHKPIHPTASKFMPTPSQLKLRQTLADVVNDKSKLPNGGYLGFGLAHEYVHTGHKLLDPLLGQLKGSDRALADACDALGLRYCLRLLYRGIIDDSLTLITTNELDPKHALGMMEEDSTTRFHLMQALRELTIEQVEVVDLIGTPWKFDPELLDEDYTVDFYSSPSGIPGHPPTEERLDFASTLRRFMREPVTQVLEMTAMTSSVDIRSAVLTYGNEAGLDYFYGTACMLIAVDPAESRKPLVV